MPSQLLVTAQQPSGELPDGVGAASWSSAYRWLCGLTYQCPWSHRLAGYFEVMEARFTETAQMDTGALTAFNGFHFGEKDAFNYLEGKRVVRLATDVLRKQSDLANLGINPEHTGRKAIRAQVEGLVWDFLAFASSDAGKSSIAYPHLSLVVTRERVLAMVTVPNNAHVSRRCLTGLETGGFLDVIDRVVDNMRPTLVACSGMEPRMRELQWHWTSRSGPPFLDADIDIDLQTRRGDSDGVKLQPE